MQPLYESQAAVLVKPGQPVNGFNSAVSGLTADQIARTYAQLMVMPPLLNQVISDLNLDMSAGALAGEITVTPVTSTTILNITARNTSPHLARDISNTLVNDFIANSNSLQRQQIDQYTSRIQAQIQQAETDIAREQADIDRLNSMPKPLTSEQKNQLSSLAQQLSADRARYAALLTDQADIAGQTARATDSVVVVSPAILPDRPVSPNLILNVLLAAVGALVMAIGVAFLLEYLDQSIKSDDELMQRVGLVAIGHVPFSQSRRGKLPELVTLSEHSSGTEAYKAMRTNLLLSSIDHEIKTIVVTSASPGEGKSRTAANLAVALAQAGHRTVIVDADFRRPNQDKIFGRIRNVGLTNMILRDKPDDEVVVPVAEVPNLWLLMSGPIPPNPSELLGSASMRALLTQLRQAFTYVIVDTPPVNAVTDPIVVAVNADGAILVIEQGRTTYPSLLRAKRVLDRVNTPTLGAVMNKLRAAEGAYYENYPYHHYGLDNRKANKGSSEPAAVAVRVSGNSG
jgi:capsular exopolysaccharide synthesis family protein